MGQTRCAGPWRVVEAPHIGGLTDVGFSDCGRYLLVQSHNGVGLIECSTGVMVARNHEVGYDNLESGDAPKYCHGIGPITEEKVPIEGLWGASPLAKKTGDGWSLAIDGTTVRLHGTTGESVEPIPQPLSEVQAFGFSKDERVLVVATSSELAIWVRP